MDDFELVRELAYMFETNPDALITAALERDVPARDIIAAYMRAETLKRASTQNGSSFESEEDTLRRLRDGWPD